MNVNQFLGVIGVFSVIIILVGSPFAFAIDDNSIEINQNSRNIDVNLDVEKRVAVSSWDYTDVENYNSCYLVTHISTFYYTGAGDNLTSNSYGFVGYKINPSQSMGTSESMNSVTSVSDESKVNCKDSMIFKYTNYPKLPLQLQREGVWQKLFVYDVNDNLISNPVMYTQIYTVEQPESDKDLCNWILNESTVSHDSYIEVLATPTSTQKAYTTDEMCKDEDKLNDDGSLGYIVLPYEFEYKEEIKKKKKSGGSSYNPPPTLGVDKDGKRLVDNGFGCNGNMVNADIYHTEYPLITTNTGTKINCELIIYDNGGVNNLKWVQVFLGVKEVGQANSKSEVGAQIILSNTELQEINITDSQNLIQNFNVTNIDVVKCKSDSNNDSCLKIIYQYEYRESPLYNIVAIDLMDNKKSSWTYTFNDGIGVNGDSINEPPTDTLFSKTSSQDKGVWLELVRTDKWNDIWVDQNGIEYHKVSDNNYNRITPLPDSTCNDKPLKYIMNGGDRNNCHFREKLLHLWK